MMARHKLSLLALLVLTSAHWVHCNNDDPSSAEPKDDLMESESKDPSKVEIIKQIKRVNDDGSYTFGYEAEDGTFKIESRDVLGNIKGTFGFVDTDGEIKRVSYTTTNTTESAVVEKDRASVIQQIPRGNRTIGSSTTRRPHILHPQITSSPSSTVIQSIPRRRLNSGTNKNESASTSTERPSFKNILKAADFETTTTETPIRTSSQKPRPTGHYIRSTVAPQPLPEAQRYTEGQLVRPETVTSRPTENYSRRLIVTRNPYLDEPVSSTIKPIVEETGFEDTVRGNLLRRQLSQEKISNFDARQHVLNLQQSTGDDSTDVYSGSLTTGPPRPLFTTTDRSRAYPTPTAPTSKAITPVKYQPVYAKNIVRSPRPQGNYVQETTTDATSTENNYASPNQVPVLQIPNNEERGIPVVRTRHPFHQGAYLIPVNQIQNGRYVIDDPNEEVQQQYVPQYAVPLDQQYYQQPNPSYAQHDPRPYHIVPRRRPIAVPADEYQRVEMPSHLFTPRQPAVPLPLNPIAFQDEIDSIKPPVSTKDFQKLLNRLIVRQGQLQEISRIENARMLQHAYVNPERYRQVVQQTPVSVFVRNRPNGNGPVQFLSQAQPTRTRSYISLPQGHSIPMQKLMESQQQYNNADPYNPNDYGPAPEYRSGRRVARLLHPGVRPKQEDDENFLPADVREMLLLRMLQLAINPNLPLPQSEGETMATAIRQQHKKPPVRNVEILGEEREEAKPVSRNKRYRESDEYEYY